MNPKQKTRLKHYQNYDYPKKAYMFFYNKKVKVVLNNGESFTGYIVKEYTYDILLVKSDGIKDPKDNELEKRTMIPKHAISYTTNFIHL
ncbi:hypothetical protein QP586_12410 [Staphylococcus sp. UMB10092B]|uniref:hypothetical protein n=1 Tax=Staphylococcus TaxID=1279 RepID=UPI0008A90B7D|nr:MULTISPECIES: hypothetical protein [Staphylococcus]MCD9056038.1 hypothetical protein [Staphylococcus arlettae]MDK7754102.1 hypothetical protein [Staphylococcus sp. UMB10092B]OHQ29802.1 hypothetical protein HMPREF2706_11710 [Staphylococcus sp. HMSC067F07]OJT31341.1 hypothetical protein BSF33_13190 [Staphylococcus ureilyticus]RIL88234.1 hypothetical protein BUY32_11540 [Staphylococcus cohnii]